MADSPRDVTIYVAKENIEPRFASCSQLQDLPTLRELNCFVSWPSKNNTFRPSGAHAIRKGSTSVSPDRRLPPLRRVRPHERPPGGYPPAEGGHRERHECV